MDDTIREIKASIFQPFINHHQHLCIRRALKVFERIKPSSLLSFSYRKPISAPLAGPLLVAIASEREEDVLLLKIIVKLNRVLAHNNTSSRCRDPNNKICMRFYKIKKAYRWNAM